MLEEIIASQLPYLELLAKGWLASGAKSFAISEDGKVLARWPESNQVSNGRLEVDLCIENLNGVRLTVDDADIEHAEEHLEADARIVSKLLQQEIELNSLASELISTRDQMLAFFNLTRATRNSLDIEQSLKQLAYEVSWLLKSEAAFLYLEAGNQRSYIAQYPSLWLDQQALAECADKFIASRDSILQVRRGELGLRPDIRNMLIVPIRSQELPVAILGVVNKSSGDFMSQDIKFVRAIAEYSGAHLENIILLQTRLDEANLRAEMKLASQIQARLSPNLPSRVRGIDIWAASRPASHVGGDFYDFIQLADESVSLVVGDVSGKGMPAALLVAMTRAIVRSEILSKSAPLPGTIISASNEKLYKDFNDVSMFATMFLGHYDPDSRRMKYGNAGHSPVVFSPAGGHPVLIGPDVIPIGISPSISSKERTIEIHEGDVVVIATDGLNNATNSYNQEFGYERLLELIDSLSGESAEKVAGGLFETIGAYSNGSSQADDQTVVVIRGISK